MSRLRTLSARALAAVSALALVVGAVACEEEGKTAPARCLDPAPPLFDIQAAGAPADDNVGLPCVTPIGHAISSNGAAAAGTSAGGSSGSAGTAGVAGAADAGAGGA